MKMTLLLLITISLSVFAIAQEKQNSFKVGTTIEYDVRPNGNQLKCFLTIDKLLEDTVPFAWMMPATMNRDAWSGKIIVTGPSLHASEIGYWDPPVNGDEMVLPGYQNFLMIPRDRYAKLKKTGQMEFDGQTFNTIMNEFGGFVEYVAGMRKFVRYARIPPMAILPSGYSMTTTFHCCCAWMVILITSTSNWLD